MTKFNITGKIKAYNHMEKSMEANKCPNCGASINEREEHVTTCTYCGGTIINKAAKDEPKVAPAAPSPSSTIFNANEPHPARINLKFKGGIFLLLLIFAWPLAFLYLAICKIQEKEDQRRK